uniref:ribosomal protein S3 n=1 Tax=Phyllosiphon coccidium TaxID=1837062 RepID=UPI002410CAED|nr:ribosomal protein S3 [Phyllosiphon coccidium]WDY12747.1 ribosomal protein S3 [Phyllosiphon coccidium]
MGQKVHPLGFRLGVSQEHNSHWFAKSQQYAQLVIEDHFLREYIYSKFPNAGIASIHIERQLDTIKLNISSARPRLLLGSFKKEKELYKGVNELRDQITTQLRAYRTYLLAAQQKPKRMRNQNPVQDLNLSQSASQNSSNPDSSSPLIDVTSPLARISVDLTKISDPDSSAACLAEFIVEQLERRVPFRRALKQAVQRAEKASVKGIKVQISGRLNGAEIARSERIHKGQVPLHTLRAKMDYKYRTARTIYGLLGVKVWIFKGFV